jgi:PAS domain S-box-containing protein
MSSTYLSAVSLPGELNFSPFFHPHDLTLVGLSVTVAVLASYTSFDLAARIKASVGSARLMWLAAGAIAMGGGIWSMHFVAMSAISLPFTVAYDPLLTMLSLAIAIAVTGAGLFAVNSWPSSPLSLGAGGLLMGCGIAAMHYTGMAAVRMPVEATYAPDLVIASIVIAVLAATGALWLAFNVCNLWIKVAGAVVMGMAVSGMHFTGMAAFQCGPRFAAATVEGITTKGLAESVAAGMLMILVLALGAAHHDRRLRQLSWDASIVQESERRIRALVRSAADVIGILDRHGAFIYLSPAAERMAGLAGRSLIGAAFPLLFSNTEQERAAALFRTALHNVGEPVQGEFTTGEPGTREWLEVILTNLLGDPAVQGIVVNLRNFTDRKHADLAIRAALDEAVKANHAKTLFLANMSHELRTPLNAIIGFSEMTKEEILGPIGNLVYRGYAEDIHASGTHLLALISDILDISRTEAGKMTVEENEEDVVELIEQCGRIMMPQCLQAGISPVLKPDGRPMLRADAKMLRQMVLNLLGNAIKFTPAGGSVTIRSSCDRNRQVIIEIIDTGVGMNADQIPVALQPFGRLGNDLHNRQGGTGLGLPLTKRLVELHGGSLTISSRPSLGTAVRLIFPPERTVDIDQKLERKAG